MATAFPGAGLGVGGTLCQVPFCALQARSMVWLHHVGPCSPPPASGFLWVVPAGAMVVEVFCWSSFPDFHMVEPLSCWSQLRLLLPAGTEEVDCKRRKIVFLDELGPPGRSGASGHIGEIHAKHRPFRKGKRPAGAVGSRSPGWLGRDENPGDSATGKPCILVPSEGEASSHKWRLSSYEKTNNTTSLEGSGGLG